MALAGFGLGLLGFRWCRRGVRHVSAATASSLALSRPRTGAGRCEAGRTISETAADNLTGSRPWRKLWSAFSLATRSGSLTRGGRAAMSDETLFDKAAAISCLADRAAFLDRECAGRPDLRREVEDCSPHGGDGP